MENREITTVIEETPQEVISTAQLAAKQLTHIVQQRTNKLVIGGKQYLYFEDWQTLGKFYGVTPRVLSTEEIFKPVKPGEDGVPVAIGYLAKAAAVCKGYEVSSAEAECTVKEKNWKDKPMFQLRSMAQTRACAKALRNCLGWVAVLAGYEALPAEEVEPDNGNKASRKLLNELIEVAKEKGYNKAEVLKYYGDYGVEKLSDLNTEQAAHLVAMMKNNEALQPELDWE